MPFAEARLLAAQGAIPKMLGLQDRFRDPSANVFLNAAYWNLAGQTSLASGNYRAAETYSSTALKQLAASRASPLRSDEEAAVATIVRSLIERGDYAGALREWRAGQGLTAAVARNVRLSIAPMQDRIALWREDNEGVHFWWAGRSRAESLALARKLRRQAMTPDSRGTEVTARALASALEPLGTDSPRSPLS